MLHKNAKIYIGASRTGRLCYLEKPQEKAIPISWAEPAKELDLLDGVAVRRFFDEEQPEYVFLAAARGRYHGKQHLPCRFHLQESPDTRTECHRRKFPPQCQETALSGQHLLIYPRDAEQPMKKTYSHLAPGYNQRTVRHCQNCRIENVRKLQPAIRHELHCRHAHQPLRSQRQLRPGTQYVLPP